MLPVQLTFTGICVKPEQKAQEMIEYILHKVIVEEDYSTLREYIVRALKEQDRDTRHACAEEVVTNLGYFGSDLDDYTLYRIHGAIMDCTGGLE